MKEASVFKKAVDGITFTDCKRYDRFLSKVPWPKLLLGHNRAATAGKVNDMNAHPFSEGDTHLVHNGTLLSYHGLHRSRETEVDSEAICFQIDHTGIKDTVSKLNGAFALASYDEMNGYFHIIRNNERPMYVASLKDKSKDVTFFASEGGILQAACSRNGVEIEEPWYLKEQILLTFDLAGNSSVGNWSVDKDIEFYIPPKPAHYMRNQVKKHGTTSTIAPVKVGNIKKGSEAKRLQRVNEVKRNLKSVGTDLGERITGSPISFKRYGTTSDKGDLTLDWLDNEDLSGSKIFRIPNVSETWYDTYKNEILSAKVVSVIDLNATVAKPVFWLPIAIEAKVLTDEETDTLWESFSEPTKEEPTSNANKTLQCCAMCSEAVDEEDGGATFRVFNDSGVLCKDCTTDYAFKARAANCSIEELITQ